MNITRLKKLPTFPKAGVYFDAENQCLVEIYRHLISNEWVVSDYPHSKSSVPLKKNDLKTRRLYGPLVLKG